MDISIWIIAFSAVIIVAAFWIYNKKRAENAFRHDSDEHYRLLKQEREKYFRPGDPTSIQELVDQDKENIKVRNYAKRVAEEEPRGTLNDSGPTELNTV